MHLERSNSSETHSLMNELEHAPNVPKIKEEIDGRKCSVWTGKQPCYRANQHQQEGETQTTALKTCRARMVGRQQVWLPRLQRQHYEILQEADLASPIALH